MGPLLAAAATTTLAAPALRATSRWLTERQHRLRFRDREQSRRDHVRNLPVGSLIVDSGTSAIVIQIGETPTDRGARVDPR